MFKNFFAILTAGVLFIIPTYSFALINYGYGQSPNDLRMQGNVYKANNPYLNSNFYNPYSKYKNPYGPDSIYHDHDKYSAQVTDYNLKPHGYVSIYVNSPHAVTNPYSSSGNLYNNNNPLNPYSENSNKKPYTSYQNPYNPNSVYQSGKYSDTAYDSAGQYRGSLNNVPYHTESQVNPYSTYGNPYQKGPANPYFANPYDHFEKYP